MTAEDKLNRLEAVVRQTMNWRFRVWGFGEAIALRGLLQAGDILGSREPFGFVHGVMRSWLGRGVARSPEDHVGAGRELVALHHATGDPAFLEAARSLAALNAGFVRGPCGARYHRSDTPGWRHQIWVDCMDVDGPFLVRLAAATGDESYQIQAVEELLGYAQALQHKSGLMFHGFEKDAGPNGAFWARGNGWALMGLIDTLSVLPRTDPAWPELHQRTNALATALRDLQDVDGLWRTIVDDSSAYLESTLAAMAAYALREAFDHDLLDPTAFGDMEQRARAAMHSQVAPDGSLRLVSDATPVGAPSTYLTRPFGVFPWGQGPLLLALNQEFL